MKYHHEFTMTGRGAFPVDMLRYDQCWPATSDDAITVTSTATGDTPAFHTSQIRLVKHSKTADPQITHARWQSFGWTIVQGSHRFNKL